MSLAVSRKTSPSTSHEFDQKLREAIELKNQLRFDESAQILLELRETHPESASVHGLLGYTLWELGQLEPAVQSFRRAVNLSPRSELASLGLFHSLLETGDKQSAIHEMNRFLRLADSEEYRALASKYRTRKNSVDKTLDNRTVRAARTADAVKTIRKVKSWAEEVGGFTKLKALVDALSD